MKKKIFILSILAFLIMISMPMVSNVQAEKLSNNFNDVKDSDTVEPKTSETKWRSIYIGVTDIEVTTTPAGTDCVKFNYMIHYHFSSSGDGFIKFSDDGGVLLISLIYPSFGALQRSKSVPIIIAGYPN